MTGSDGRTRVRGRTTSSKARELVAIGLLACCASACFGGGGITPIRTPFNKGVYQFSTGNFDGAIAEFRDALHDNPDDHRARFNLAMALEAKADEVGNTEDAAHLRETAEDEYRTLLERKPGDLRASINLAAIEYSKGMTEEAKQRLRETIARYVDIPLPRTALATFLLREKDAAEALRVLDGALDIDPASLEANMLAGDAKLALGDPEGARHYYLKALQRDDSDLATLLALGRLEYEAQRYRDGIVWLERLLLIDPDHYLAHHLLSECFEKQGNTELALYHLWAARDLDHTRNPSGNSPDYRARLIELYRRALEEQEKKK